MSSGYNDSQDKTIKVKDFTKGMRQEEKNRGSETCMLKIQKKKKLAKIMEKEKTVSSEENQGSISRKGWSTNLRVTEI